MRTQVILIPIGSAGDVFPFLALGQELQRRKHHVAVMTNPIFKTNVGQAGLEFIDLGSEEELRAVGNDTRLHQSGQAWKLALRWGAVGTMRQTVTYLQKRHQRCATLLVASPLSFGARLASEAFEIPLATVIMSPFVLRSVYDAPRIKPMWLGDWMPRVLKSLQYRFADRFVIDPVVKDDVNELQRELGLPQAKRFLHQWCFSNDLCLGAFPEKFAAHQPDWPESLRLTGNYVWDPPVESQDAKAFENFVALDDQPLVGVSSGSAGAQSADYYQAWIAAAQRVGCKLLILERNHEVVPVELPTTVLHLRYFPMDKVLKYASGVVHCGGVGATLRSLNAGVPQMVIPRVNDQFDNARRVERLGAGIVVEHPITTQQMGDGLRRLISGEFKIERVAQRDVDTQDSVVLGCDYLESFFYRHTIDA